MGENITIRTAEIRDFDGVYGLLKQLWAKRELNRDALATVGSNRGTISVSVRKPAESSSAFALYISGTAFGRKAASDT